MGVYMRYTVTAASTLSRALILKEKGLEPQRAKLFFFALLMKINNTYPSIISKETYHSPVAVAGTDCRSNPKPAAMIMMAVLAITKECILILTVHCQTGIERRKPGFSKMGRGGDGGGW